MGNNDFASGKRREAAYLTLARSGELGRRAEQAQNILANCTLCPRACHADRLHGQIGTCRTGRTAIVSSWFPHHGEERCLRGRNGSGTIFFAWCNLRCVFCQNAALSWGGEGEPLDARGLAAAMLELQARGCHNINLVTPTHVVPQILEALVIAAEAGLKLPLVYNSSAYDALPVLTLLDGVVDIYMPDFKFWDEEKASRYLNAPDYPEVARGALREMHRQVGSLIIDEDGIAQHGVLLRHLVMPGAEGDTRDIMTWVAQELGADTYVNVMAQYWPSGQASSFPEIARGITGREFSDAMESARAAGLRRFDPRT